MDVLVDANAIRSAGLNGAAIKALKSYLAMTGSRLLLPDVVVVELCAQQRSYVEEHVRKLATAHRKIRRIFPEVDLKTPELDVEAAVGIYHTQLLAAAERVETLRNEAEDLPELVRRLAARILPASISGEEARDVLIWLVVRRVAGAGRVAFISADKRAFWKNDNLHPDLVEDLGAVRDNVLLFSDINAFLKDYRVTRLSFIEQEWVVEQINSETVANAVNKFVDEHSDIFEEKVLDKGDPSGYVSFIQIVQHRVEEFFVSDIADDELYVSATVWAELEVEVEFYTRPDSSHFPYWLARSRRRRETDDEEGEEYHRDERRRTAKCECIYPCVRMQVQLDVTGRDLRSAFISSMKIE